jgi:hypothetical protein
MDTMVYHTCSGGTYDIWLAADGERSLEELAALVYGGRSRAAVALAQMAVHELTMAGLMTEDDGDAPSLLSRRRVARLAAAGVLGGVGLPLVKSITAPDAASADTCLAEWDSPHECGAGDSCRCFSGCCCQRPGLSAICFDAASCRAAGSGYFCI